jgi:hypothetical protein
MLLHYTNAGSINFPSLSDSYTTPRNHVFLGQKSTESQKRVSQPNSLLRIELALKLKC